MAKRRLKDRPCAVNPPPPSSFPTSSTLNEATDIDFTNLFDEINECIRKAKAMIEVAYLEGLENCSSYTQHYYLLAMDDQFNAVAASFNKFQVFWQKRSAVP